MNELPVDDLDRAIVALCARLNAATYELLVLIRRFDERGGWLAWGFQSCADWLHWRCDIGRSAAREKVRVAHALKMLPATSQAFGEGSLSYSKVRALTRVATADNEHDLLGFVELARAYLRGKSESRCGDSEHYRVTVHVDQTALADGTGRSGLPVESVKRLCCDGETVVLVEDERGEPLNIGRKTRVVPTAIKRALWARDRGCRFPGCHRKRFVDAHHVEHWSAGGETSLANLVLLCDAHHRLVHEGGFKIEKDYRDRWCFLRPDGIAVPSCGYRPEDITDGPSANDSHSKNPSAEGFLSCAGLEAANDLKQTPAI
jgi:Domain of unknown function (DUF222)/HNH endonuclease